MIVYPAYIYMGGGAAVNPYLWQDGVANYPVEFTNSSIFSGGLLVNANGGSATFSELPLTGFKSLTISGNGSAQFVDAVITIEFFNNDGQLLGTESANFSRSGNTRTVNVPASARIKKAKIKMSNTSPSSATLSSALLT